MAGWRLTNATRGGQVPPFIFPTYTIGPDETIAVFSQVDDDDLEAGDFFWDQTGEVWCVGDRAELRDAQGTLVDSLIVPNQ